MADLDGDHLPDIYLLNYLDDPAIARKPPLNRDGMAIEAINPTSFKSSRDEWCQNDGQGNWLRRDVGEVGNAQSTSLGVLVAPFDGFQNQVFIANDELANQLWHYNHGTATFHDLALTRSCAFNHLGSPAGSMGIAAADFDRSGTCDLLVTHFYRESNHLYMNSGTAFRDLNVRYGIDRVSALQLGFGCQAIDCNNQGVWDLAVLNGHVENLEHLGQPFYQTPQILQFDGRHFQQAEPNGLSEYFTKKHLGRALASGDFNRDGRTDLIATDLMEPVALLINKSPSKAHWLRLKLVGTHSERDAVGARVQLHIGEQIRTRWVFAGDGYLAKNEAVVQFGLGADSQIDAIEIQWPSGDLQTWLASEIPVDREYLCCEGEPVLLMLSD